MFKRIRDSFFSISGSQRANSVENGFQIKNILNTDNVIFSGRRKLPPSELEDIYLNDAWVKKCINLTINDVFKNGISIDLPAKFAKTQESFEKYFFKEYADIFKRAFFEVLVYGGGLVLKKDEYQSPSGNYELSEGTELIQVPYIQYSALPNYIKGTQIIDGVSKWMIGSSGSVSPSFVISFKGDEIPYSRQDYYKYQGVGVLEANLEMIKLSSVIISSLANATFRNGVFTYKIKDLKDAKTSGSRERITQFMQNLELVNKGLNSTAMMQIDIDEDVAVLNINLAQYKEIMSLTVQMLVGLFGFTATRLLGASPSGLNATGESDIYMNVDTIETYQKKLNPQMNEFLQIALFKFYGEEFEFSWAWNSSRTMSDKNRIDFEEKVVKNAMIVQDIQSIEGLEYLYSNDLITGEQFEERKKRLLALEGFGEEDN